MSESLAADWGAKADADLDAVERRPGGTLPNIIVGCCHCQQAAEKLVKALLVADGIRHPRGKEGHDIGLCASLLPSAHPLRRDAEALDDLTDWATAFRYPAEDPVTAEPLPEVGLLRSRWEDVKRFRADVGALVGRSG